MTFVGAIGSIALLLLGLVIGIQAVIFDGMLCDPFACQPPWPLSWVIPSSM